MMINFADDGRPPGMSPYFGPHQFLFFKFESVLLVWPLKALTWIRLFKGWYLDCTRVRLDEFVQMFGPVYIIHNFLSNSLLLFVAVISRQSNKPLSRWPRIWISKIIFMIGVESRGRRRCLHFIFNWYYFKSSLLPMMLFFLRERGSWAIVVSLVLSLIRLILWRQPHFKSFHI